MRGKPRRRLARVRSPHKGRRPGRGAGSERPEGGGGDRCVRRRSRRDWAGRGCSRDRALITVIGPLSPGEVVASVISSPDLPTLRELLDAHEDLLLTDASAGRFSVVRHAFMHDRGFQERVDAMRLALMEGRDHRLAGTYRSLSALFAGMFAEGKPHAELVVPRPGAEPPGDPEAVLVAQIVSAFVRAQSWTERRQIVAAYESVFRSGEVEAMLEAL